LDLTSFITLLNINYQIIFLFTECLQIANRKLILDMRICSLTALREHGMERVSRVYFDSANSKPEVWFFEFRWCFANKPNSMSSTTFTGVLPKADRKAF
jgi:hypothetical protein